jgi:hypothetical protein
MARMPQIGGSRRSRTTGFHRYTPLPTSILCCLMMSPLTRHSAGTHSPSPLASRAEPPHSAQPFPFQLSHSMRCFTRYPQIHRRGYRPHSKGSKSFVVDGTAGSTDLSEYRRYVTKAARYRNDSSARGSSKTNVTVFAEYGFDSGRRRTAKSRTRLGVSLLTPLSTFVPARPWPWSAMIHGDHRPPASMLSGAATVLLPRQPLAINEIASASDTRSLDSTQPSAPQAR